MSDVGSTAEEPMVCGLPAGGEWIRTSGSAMRSHRQPRGPGRPAGGRRGPPHARQMAHRNRGPEGSNPPFSSVGSTNFRFL